MSDNPAIPTPTAPTETSDLGKVASPPADTPSAPTINTSITSESEIPVPKDENGEAVDVGTHEHYKYSYEVGQRDPNGVYLDEENLKRAEIQRAKAEGREPDFNNMAGIASTPLLRDQPR